MFRKCPFSTTGHILRVSVHFFGPFNKCFKIIVWIENLPLVPLWHCDQTLLNLSLHYICALYCYCNELISYLEGQLLLTISHCILSRITRKKLLVKQSLHVRVSNEKPINGDLWLIASWRGRKKVHRQLITDQLDCDASTSSWSYSTWKSLSSKQ